MDENPYKAPNISVALKEKPPWGPFALGLAVVCGALISLAIAALVALVVAFFTLDTRENPRYWDKVHAREEARKAAEEAQATDSRATQIRTHP